MNAQFTIESRKLFQTRGPAQDKPFSNYLTLNNIVTLKSGLGCHLP